MDDEILTSQEENEIIENPKTKEKKIEDESMNQKTKEMQKTSEEVNSKKDVCPSPKMQSKTMRNNKKAKHNSMKIPRKKEVSKTKKDIKKDKMKNNTKATKMVSLLIISHCLT